MTSREFNQDVSRAKRSADGGPVIITDRGEPAYVLMTHSEYVRLTGTGKNLLEMLDMPGMEDIEFDPPKIDLKLRVPDFD
ncbi:MAG: type II toxin-antitoxin system prevent-host-death family antitoxin [Hyphomicrobiaceae bacterium]